jgi:hypothetical protein
MLLHAMRMWPGLITPEIWPFAILQASQIHNHSPRHGKTQSPHKIFTNEAPTIHPNDFCVFGCPVFVLVKELQKIEKPYKNHGVRAATWEYTWVSPKTIPAM